MCRDLHMYFHIVACWLLTSQLSSTMQTSANSWHNHQSTCTCSRLAHVTDKSRTELPTSGWIFIEFNHRSRHDQFTVRSGHTTCQVDSRVNLKADIGQPLASNTWPTHKVEYMAFGFLLHINISPESSSLHQCTLYICSSSVVLPQQNCLNATFNLQQNYA